jgi:regulator of protease activity HflC (stomatin/prohibitin superfamily)
LKRKQSTPRQLDIGVAGLLATAVLLGITAYYLNDSLQVRYGFFGSLIWFIVLAAAFFFSLLYFAQFLLPTEGMDGWVTGLRLLSRSYFEGALPAPNQRPLSPTLPTNIIEENEALPITLSASFLTLKAGIVRSHYALALARGQSFSRPAGPGFVMLNPKEIITNVIDLRRQVRTQSVQANTRDGIPVETNLTVVFRVRQVIPEHNEDDILYPYDREAIFHVSYANSVDGRSLRNWTEQISRRAAAILIDELAQYRLNDLYQDDASIAPFDMIQQTIKRQLDRNTEQLGVQILAVSVGHLQLPPEVVDQRIKSWQVNWERQIRVQKAVGDAEAGRRLKNARARAQIEIIHNITQNIDAMRRAGNNNLTQIIMLRMIDALEEATGDPTVQMILPQELIGQLVEEASGQMKDWLLEADGKPHV